MYIYCLIFHNPYNVLYQKIETFVNKLSTVFIENNADIIKFHRISCLYILLLKLCRFFYEKSARQVEILYQDFENMLSNKDSQKEFGFIKPLFKEQFTLSFILTKKCKLRRFLYNMTITADYYGAKLSENQNYFYTLYLYLVCFAFYKKEERSWNYIIHYITQTLAQHKNQMARNQFAFAAFVRFFNTYLGRNDIIDGESQHLVLYLKKLENLLEHALEESLTSGTQEHLYAICNLALFKIKREYDVRLHEELQSVSLCRFNAKSLNLNSKRYSEFIELLDKYFDPFKLVNEPNIEEDLEILYCNENRDRRKLLYQKIRDAFVNEEINLVIPVKNLFNVGSLARDSVK